MEHCPHCRHEVHTEARVCGACGATRKKASNVTWKTAREGRRDDIILAGLGLCLFLFAGLFVLTTVLGIAGAGRTTTRTNPQYGTCSVSSPLWPEC